MRQPWRRGVWVSFVPALVLAGCAVEEGDGEPTLTASPRGVVDVTGLVPLDPLPSGRVAATDPAVVALNGELGWAPGQSSFISADGQWATYYGSGWGMPYAPVGGAASANPYAEGDGRTVEQGDVYAALDERTIVNLNTYRGLQVIDVSDLQDPRLVSRLPIAGTPVELYVLEQWAIVLLNGWQGQAGSSAAIMTDAAQGGVALIVDLSNPSEPRVTARHRLAGTVAQSRLTCGEADQALYVASMHVNELGLWDTVLESFSVTDDGGLTARSQLAIDGAVNVIQATPEAMLVARNDASGLHSRVLVVDISDPKGHVQAGADVALAGFVTNHSNLDYRGGILRAMSTAGWGTEAANHIETFAATGSSTDVTPVDHLTFSPGQSLFGTLFLETSAFAVTYLRVDPLHAFELDAAGDITERSEFIISGWNDFFRPVLGQTRMIGVGVDDTGGWHLALSLYDITDLESETPLVERRAVPVEGAWTPAQSDHRAFAVLEDVVAVESDPPGAIETGLLMLPVSGYDTAGSPVNGTQLFTFSAETLTPRGLVSAGNHVRRAFSVDDAAANLSDYELGTFEYADPDDPSRLGTVALAPNYVGIEAFGEHYARIEDRSMYTGGPGTSAGEVQIIEGGGDPDLTEPVATFEVPQGAQLVRAGDALVGLASRYEYGADGSYRYLTDVTVYDLSNPEAPREAGRLTTDRIQPFYGYGYDGGSYGSYYGEYGYTDYCYGAYPVDYYSAYGCGSMPTAEAYAVGEDAIAFVRHLPQQRVLGTEHYCIAYPENGGYGCAAGTEQCTVLSGYVECRSLDEGPERCTNAMQWCTAGSDGSWQCRPVPDEELADLRTYESCYDYELYRYWESYELDLLDVSDPDAPAMLATLVMPVDEENAGVFANGSDLFVISKVPVQVEGDARPFVRYYFRRIGLDDAGAPEIGEPVNVPGELIEVDGTTLYTRDFAWGETVIEPAVNRLELEGTRAFLEARRVFTDEEAYRASLDGEGRLLLTHRVAQVVASAEPGFDYLQWRPVLSVLDADGDFATLGEVELDSWMTFQQAYRGRALVSVPSGLFVLNVARGTPEAEAFLPSLGVPREPIVEGSRITFASGLFGVYRFDLDDPDLRIP